MTKPNKFSKAILTLAIILPVGMISYPQQAKADWYDIFKDTYN